MQIFLSWSTERSRDLAKLLKHFIPEVIPTVDTFMSESDLRPGDEWADKLFEKLKQSQVCIACITKDSLESPWIHFEAGAVMNQYGKNAAAENRVFALLLGLDRQLSGPLAQFTTVKFDEQGLRQMMEALDIRANKSGKKSKKFDDLFQRAVPGILAFERGLLDVLMQQSQAHRAPFLLARASMLQQKNSLTDSAGQRVRLSDSDKWEALCELIDKIDQLEDEHGYLHKVIKKVEKKSVWAVCGQKTEHLRGRLYSVNAEAAAQGCRIERLFFPPASPEEQKAIEQGINQHIDGDKRAKEAKKGGRMRALAFAQGYPNQLHSMYGLPAGFGMTLMEERGDGTGPARLEAVLIHWGGVADGAGHCGLILEHWAWTLHFLELFNSLRELAQYEVTKNLWDDLIGTNPFYGPWPKSLDRKPRMEKTP